MSASICVISLCAAFMDFFYFKLPAQCQQIVHFVVPGSWVYHVPYLHFSYKSFCSFIALWFVYSGLETNQGIAWWSYLDFTAFCYEILIVSLGTQEVTGDIVIDSALGDALCLQDTLGKEVITSGIHSAKLRNNLIKAQLFIKIKIDPKCYWKDGYYCAQGRTGNNGAPFILKCATDSFRLITLSFPVYKMERVMTAEDKTCPCKGL